MDSVTEKKLAEQDALIAILLKNFGAGPEHLFEGDCPDEHMPDARDEFCDACKMLDIQIARFPQEVALMYKVIDALLPLNLVYPVRGAPGGDELWDATEALLEFRRLREGADGQPG